MWQLETVVSLLAAGSIAGFVAGLLGVGGGLLIVPVVLWALQMHGFGASEHAQHLAVGTSFAVMVFTSFSSMRAQQKKGAVDWQIFVSMAPGMVIGVALGAVVARYLPNKGLQVFFALFCAVIAWRSLMNVQPKPSRRLPGKSGLAAAGGLFGLLSSWIGIGGGSLSIPFMASCNVPMHRAVGTSAALGWPIALVGSIGYLAAGWSSEHLPPGAWGFIYLPVMIVLAAATLVFAPLGVKVSHKLPPAYLKKAFGILLLLITAKMLWQIWR